MLAFGQERSSPGTLLRSRASQHQTMGYLQEATGWCGFCSRPNPPKNPPMLCASCGELRCHAGLGVCSRCLPEHHETMVQWAMIILMRRRFALTN